MPKEFQRSTRVAEQIQRELAGMMSRVLENPRAGMVTVTAVEVSKDLSHAKVYVSSLGGNLPHEELVAQLQHASGFMRHELGRVMKLRIQPELRFYYDQTEERAARLEALIAKANTPDGGKQGS